MVEWCWNDVGEAGGTVTVTGERRIRARRWAAAICLLIAATTAGGVPAYVRPQVDPLRPADVVVVLGGADWSRYPYGIELAQNGWAPQVVFSNPAGTRDDWMTQVCAAPHPDFELHCFVPDPPTTRGEAQELSRLAKQFHWHHLIVVTFTPHISRARYILERCFDGELTMVASSGEVSAPRWVYEYAYQTVGFVKAVLQPGC
ncbi:YdcF family protein [Rhodococcus olei]|uniref:YdcF family protein n=1 Tax=Rhodococcus olei TaxID=2161675 RepID=A0ABP8NU23_9NOCA